MLIWQYKERKSKIGQHFTVIHVEDTLGMVKLTKHNEYLEIIHPWCIAKPTSL